MLTGGGAIDDSGHRAEMTELGSIPADGYDNDKID